MTMVRVGRSLCPECARLAAGQPDQPREDCCDGCGGPMFPDGGLRPHPRRCGCRPETAGPVRPVGGGWA